MRKEISITLSPQDLASEFCEMGSDKQVEFLSLVALQFRGWGVELAQRQHCHIAEQLVEHPAARAFVKELEHWALFTEDTPTRSGPEPSKAGGSDGG